MPSCAVLMTSGKTQTCNDLAVCLECGFILVAWLVPQFSGKNYILAEWLECIPTELSGIGIAAMTVAVLVVNWNAGPLLGRCLQSLARQSRLPDRIVVVDNASSDDSLELAAPHLGGAEVIRLNDNVGFARANNIAARAAGDVDALVLLNPDAFPEPGWLGGARRRRRAIPGVRGVRQPDEARRGARSSRRRRRQLSRLRTRLAQRPQRAGRELAGRRVRSLRAVRCGGTVPPCGVRRDRRVRRVATSVTSRTSIWDSASGCTVTAVSTCPTSVVRHVSSALSGYRSDFAVYHGERNASGPSSRTCRRRCSGSTCRSIWRSTRRRSSSIRSAGRGARSGARSGMRSSA